MISVTMIMIRRWSWKTTMMMAAITMTTMMMMTINGGGGASDSDATSRPPLVLPIVIKIIMSSDHWLERTSHVQGVVSLPPTPRHPNSQFDLFNFITLEWKQDICHTWKVPSSITVAGFSSQSSCSYMICSKQLLSMDAPHHSLLYFPRETTCSRKYHCL